MSRYGNEKMIDFLSPYSPTYHYLLYFQDSTSITFHPEVFGTDLGVSHAEDVFYLWDIFGYNDGTGIYDFWWSDENKLNSKR